jgi:endothelin-converting enzyme/putative endopeptidase
MRIVRSGHLLLTLLVACSATAADNPNLHNKGLQGVQVDDIDRKAEPCTDFFAYANGRWRAENPIPGSMPRWSRRWAAGEANKDKLREILEQAATMKAQRGSIEQLTGDFYAGCMNEAQANSLGAKPIAPLLAQIDSIRNAADLQKTIGELHMVAIAAPFTVLADSDVHNPSFVIAQYYASALGMPDRDYYLKDDARFEEAREKYRAYMQRLFALAGSNEAQAKAAAETVMRLETRYAQASLDNVELRDPQKTDHKMAFAELQKLTPAFDWSAYYTATGLPQGELNVNEPKLMQEFDRQLRETSLADWQTYLRSRVLDSAAPSLSDEFVKAEFAFREEFLNGAREMKPRWKRCAEATDSLLGDALGRKYVEKYFPPEAKARMLELVKNLQLGMKETIEGLEWMGPQTKARALEKLGTFRAKIGYPDKWKDYSSVAVRRDAYWESVIAARRFGVQDDHKQINKPVDRDRWFLTAPTSDAYYNATLNEIVFPAGILQPPAFSMQAADAVNYGAIGVVIGHEFSHGFDDQGAQFDAQGRLKNWWTEADLKKFQERGECVVKQYEGYFIEPGVHHNGKLVLGESIGDLAGAKIAYRGFKISQRGKAPPPTIDGFTPDQQFFIAWGQFRGDEVRPEFARTMVQGDPHPVAKFRVIGSVSNLPEFQQAFQCKAGSPMVRKPEERCEVW